MSSNTKEDKEERKARR
jgi:N12 class adenine-specific DNA methylase